MSADGFLGRWSRRKADAREGRPLAEPPPPEAAPTPTPAGAAAPVAGVAAHAAPPPVAPPAAAATVPDLTLADTEALTPASDFRPFVARSVAPAVRNAAMKKLFADPHFNVMDRLDIYIDDYGRPDPLPAAQLREMASAKFLKLVDDEPEAARTGESADAPARPAVAQSPQPADPRLPTDAPAPPLAATTTETPEHAHAHLRLQPDHAAPAPDAGREPE